MKIAISCSQKRLDGLLDGRFGRCACFCIYDTCSKKDVYIDNLGIDSSGGAGIVAAQCVIDQGVEAVITGSLGPNAYDLICKSNIKAYNSEELPISKVIDNFNEGKLELIDIKGRPHMGI